MQAERPKTWCQCIRCLWPEGSGECKFGKERLINEQLNILHEQVAAQLTADIRALLRFVMER